MRLSRKFLKPAAPDIDWPDLLGRHYPRPKVVRALFSLKEDPEHFRDEDGTADFYYLRSGVRVSFDEEGVVFGVFLSLEPEEAFGVYRGALPWGLKPQCTFEEACARMGSAPALTDISVRKIDPETGEPLGPAVNIPTAFWTLPTLTVDASFSAGDLRLTSLSLMSVVVPCGEEAD